MKLVIMILLSYTASATNYYVKVGGSDVANGLTEGTAWASISKVNSTATNGDSVFFNRGDAWNEKIIPASANIYYGAYGSGVKPLITGFVSVTGFSDSSNIKTKVLTNSVPKLNTVYIDGALRGKGRSPNSGYTQTATSPTTTTISTSLTGTPNYAGAEVAAKITAWIIDVHRIVSQSAGVLTIDEPLSRSPGYAFGGNGYFLLNDLRFLDVNNEWALDSASRTLRIRATSTPTVKVSNIDTLVFLSKKDNITFENITFEGANKTGFQIDTSYTVTVINCTIKDMGGMGITGLKCSRFTLQNDSVFNCLDNGVSFWPYSGSYIPVSPELRKSDSCLFDNNYFHNIGFIAGMGGSGNVHYEGLMSVGDDCVITNNRMDSIGYSAIYFNGKRTLIQNNYITNYCFLKSDGAAVQTGLGGAIPDSGSIIRKNIIFNGIGNLQGTNLSINYATGVYIDDLNTRVLIDSNTISISQRSTLNLHNADSVTVQYNTIVNSTGDVISINNASSPLHNVFNNNISYSSSASYYNFYKSGTGLGTSDNNYYSRPVSETNNFRSASTNYSLAGWRTLTGQEANSQGTVSGVTAAAPILIYNATSEPQTSDLTGTYKDLLGNSYTGSITVAPFMSALIYKATVDIFPDAPAPPTQFNHHIKLKVRILPP